MLIQRTNKVNTCDDNVFGVGVSACGQIGVRMWGWIWPEYCVQCGQFAWGDLNQGHCILCVLTWPDLRGKTGNALVQSRVHVPWACAGFRIPGSDSLRARIHGLKYGGNRQWGLEAGQWVAQGVEWPFGEEPVGLVPVPLHWRRKAYRGYNQSEWIARGMAEVWGVPVWTSLLGRHKFGGSLTSKGRSARQQQLQGTYAVRSPPQGQRHFVLVDDVLTTGSTCRAAAQILEAYGACWRGLAVWGLA